MRLEQLYPNFGNASPEDQAAYISAYRLRRAVDLAVTPTVKKSSDKKSIYDLSLNDEEQAMMKLLGIKKKDIIALRAMSEVVEEDNDTGLLTDSTFEEGEEE
jgi:hypothetical protein